MVGRALLRSALSRQSDGQVPETDWRFLLSDSGKPFAGSAATSSPFFNLSYTTGLIAVAVAEEVEVGIDIEIGQAFPNREIPWHLFSEGEQKHLRAAAPQDFWWRFMRLWTLKEAIAKRMGTGFATAFSEIDTTLLAIIDGPDRIASGAEAEPALCHLCLTMPEGTAHLSISTAPVT